MTEWRPHPKQQEALKSTCYETLFGGARGGGKTDTGMANLLYDIDNPNLRQLVIRRNYDDLKDWIDRARSFYRAQKPTFTLSTREIVFPSGAKIILGHLKDDGAYAKYQGHEYQRILIEELTHIPSEELYLKLLASCRSTVPGLPARLFATTNPGEIGHKWVKRRFVDVARPGQTYEDPVTGRTRLFVQSRVEDNPTLMEADPDYVKFLDGLPDGLRQQWREGSWDDIEIKGAYFTQQIKQAQQEQRLCRIPYDNNIPVDFYWDLGIDDEMAIWATQEWGKEIRVIQYWHFSDMSLLDCLGMIGKSRYAHNLGKMFFPHDIRVRELSTGKTRLDSVEEYAQAYDFKTEVVPKMNPEERVHALRLVFPKLWFDTVNCEDGIDALRAYRKEYDEKNLTFKNAPKHDWASHACDAIGMLGVVHKEKLPEYAKPIQFSDLGVAKGEDTDMVNPFGV